MLNIFLTGAGGIKRFIYEAYIKNIMAHRNFKLINLLELPLVLLSLFVLIASFFTFGLFFFPVIAIAIAGGILRWINPETRGFMFVYHTLALSGGFILFLIIILYSLFAPLFKML